MDKEYLIKKWLSEELTEAEHEAFEQMEDYQIYKDILKNAMYFKASTFSNVSDFETFGKKLETTNTPVIRLPWVQPILRIAGIFIIGFALYYFFLFNPLVEIQTLASEKITIELPDASTVVVNALSEVSYSKNKWEQKREIALDGEAFFEVAKGSKFNVITSDGIVSVVGTTFNVKQRADFFEVKCFEGIVRVTAQNKSEQLKAGDSYRIVAGKATHGKTVYQNPQWTKNVSSFERVPLSEVISELERQYNIKVAAEGIPYERLFTGGFVHDDLENALQSICQPLDLTYTIKASNKVRLYPSEN